MKYQHPTKAKVQNIYDFIDAAIYQGSFRVTTHCVFMLLFTS